MQLLGQRHASQPRSNKTADLSYQQETSTISENGRTKTSGRTGHQSLTGQRKFNNNRLTQHWASIRNQPDSPETAKDSFATQNAKQASSARPTNKLLHGRKKAQRQAEPPKKPLKAHKHSRSVESTNNTPRSPGGGSQ